MPLLAGDTAIPLHALREAWSSRGRHAVGHVAFNERQGLLHLSEDTCAGRLPLEICKGVLLGLYRIRGTKGDEFRGWAEDFPAEAAADVLSTWGWRRDRKQAKGTNR